MSFMKTWRAWPVLPAGLTPLIEAPHGVEVTSRQDGDTTYYFLLNLTENRARQDNAAEAHGRFDSRSAWNYSK